MKDAPNYKDSVEELESIVGEIEDESVDIDVLAKKVKRAAFLIKLCRKRLKTTDNEIKKILKEFKKGDEA